MASKTYKIVKKTMQNKQTQRGQIILEILWLAILASVFLFVISTMYNEGQKEITNHRIGKIYKTNKSHNKNLLLKLLNTLK